MNSVKGSKNILFNLGVFSVLGLFTIVYLKAVQPNLVKKRAANHYVIIENTVDHLQRLKINFTKKDLRTFLLSTRFLFQSLDRVQFFDMYGNLIGDTNILDLDQNVFTRSDIIIEETIDGKIKKQKFTGVLIGKKHSPNEQTILTVRRASQGFEVEKVFVRESPQIEYIKTVREAKVRRAKLYFLRGRLGKKARLKKKA